MEQVSLHIIRALVCLELATAQVKHGYPGRSRAWITSLWLAQSWLQLRVFSDVDNKPLVRPELATAPVNRIWTAFPM
ncbi:hypothetical protein C5167_047710 [Papaver somniferum]|uniref:Secreted protein n=1 Tax=Papaver somniferum TaxID=3469 RepID=A0A4Y7LL35_PAPSO|nr:hypothetical protein C5167_047710 [Papaver somniferum]